MLTVNFTPFPVLFTERLILKQILDEDADQLFGLRSDMEIMKYIPRKPAETIQDAQQLLRHFDEVIHSNEKITWGIFIKETVQLIGTIGYVNIHKENYRAEMGYLLSREYHGRGIMTEALKAIINYGFCDMQLHSIEAIVHPDNHSSIRLLEKHQFVKEAYLKDNQFFDGKFIDSVIYSLINPQ